MIVLGISGFFNTPERTAFKRVDREFFHNSAAALVVDGEVRSAAEEERFDRIKNSNFFPANAIAYCLTDAGLRLSDVDQLAYFYGEEYVTSELLREAVDDSDAPVLDARGAIIRVLKESLALGHAYEDINVTFVRHHEAHAASALRGSDEGEPALVCIMDGNGETQGISLFAASSEGTSLLREYGRENSLGHFYSAMTRYLGFGRFDEYKVMGLAPYGDPDLFRGAFVQGITLEQGGDYSVSWEICAQALARAGVPPRRKGERIGAAHRSVAAALQDSLTRIVLHILRQAKTDYGLSTICLSGGVAQNSVLNGVIADSGLFSKVHVDAVAHDAGAALGAALHISTAAGHSAKRRVPGSRKSIYLGPDISLAKAPVADDIARWAGVIDWEQHDDPNDLAAELLGDGRTMGYARGRAEFGPRALGNRSILADPRPLDMRDHINSVIKLRESFRPLAPAVLEEWAEEYFVLPRASTTLDYMGVVVQTRPAYREILRAVTHVDGSARIQVVRPDVNPGFADLLQRFHHRAGIPVLLNTSFNNYAEPMVLTAADAIRCYLTSGLDCLVLGGVVVTGRKASDLPWAQMRMTVQHGTELVASPRPRARVGVRARRPEQGLPWECRNRFTSVRLPVSAELADTIQRALTDSNRTAEVGDGWDASEVLQLWEARMIDVRPRE
jgi:carbamoyltransferase